VIMAPNSFGVMPYSVMAIQPREDEAYQHRAVERLIMSHLYLPEASFSKAARIDGAAAGEDAG